MQPYKNRPFQILENGLEKGDKRTWGQFVWKIDCSNFSDQLNNLNSWTTLNSISLPEISHFWPWKKWTLNQGAIILLIQSDPRKVVGDRFDVSYYLKVEFFGSIDDFWDAIFRPCFVYPEILTRQEAAEFSTVRCDSYSLFNKQLQEIEF